MNFEKTLIPGLLIKRYKRFFVDVKIGKMLERYPECVYVYGTGHSLGGTKTYFLNHLWNVVIMIVI